MIDLRTPDQSAHLAALARELDAEPEVPPPPVRRKLPAYGKALLQARRMGQHPAEITVVYGDDWRGVAPPRLCVKPHQYQPGAMDWRVVAGVKVTALDLAGGLGDFDLTVERFGPFYSLVGELAAMQAYVVVRYPERGKWLDQDADALAYACRVGGRWPAWWSDDLDRLHRAAFNDYMSDMERSIRRKFEDGQGQ